MHESRDGATLNSSLGRIVWYPLNHEERTEVGIPQAQSAEVIRLLGYGRARKLCHVDGDFENQCPQATGMAEGLDVEPAGFRVVELQQVERGQVASSIVEKHVFAARIRGVDSAVGRTRMPLVDRRIK